MKKQIEVEELDIDELQILPEDDRVHIQKEI